MRIEHLVFERYGLFTDRRLAFHPQAALHVVLGNNEAGKTSALSGIGDLLFGFGGRTDYDFRHDSSKLRIGGAFRHSDGRLIAARRRKGRQNTLFDADDKPLSDDTLAAVLDGLTREAFSRDFGLTARALRDGGEELLSAGGRLAETLAASSAGMTALSRVKDRLQSEADELFTPRKSASRQFYIAAERRDAADKKLRDAIVTREALSQMEKDVTDALAARDDLTAAHARSVGTLARWQRTLRVRSHLARLDAINADLATLAHLPDVPPQTMAAWRVAFDADADCANELAVLDGAAASDAAEIAALAVDDRLLAEGAAIDALRERLGAVRKAIDDLPRRRSDRDAAIASLDDAARRLGLGSHVELLTRLPTDPAQAQARDLIERIKTTERMIGDAIGRLARAGQERDAFATDDGTASLPVDVAQLRQRFDALGDIPAQADRLRRDTAARGLETDAITAMLASLDPVPGPLETLRALPLPERAVIERYANASDKADAELKRLDALIEAHDAAIAAAESELARLCGAGGVPTRSDLATARQDRDTHLNGLRIVLDGEAAQRVTRFGDVVTSVQAIDRLTDRLLDDTERAALYDEAQRRLIETRTTRDSDTIKRARIESERVTLQTRWREEWTASGIAPRGPAAMLRWRERLDEVITRLSKREAQTTDFAALTARLAEGKSAVIAFLGHAGLTCDQTLPADVLYREAKIRIDALQAASADAKARAVAVRRIERDVTEADAARYAGEISLATHRHSWPSAMAGIGLVGDSTAAQAEAALAVWREVPVPKTTYESEMHRVAAIESDLLAFDRDVFDVVDRAAPALRVPSAQDALAQLSSALADARRAAEASRRLQESATKRAATRQGLLARRMALMETLADARRALGLTDNATLAQPLDQLATRHRLDADRSALRRDLRDIGDGHDEPALRTEREGIDLDLLSGDIARETLAQQQLLLDLNEASAVHHHNQRVRDELMKGRDAALAAAERAEASADLLSIAERWLLRSAAARLATRAIEKHRAMVQDPLIARASVLFTTATADAFAGLGIDYGDVDQPVLMARRRDGERVPIAGLSEGTRDQLFLALRLALLERRSSEPMPFIGDDLLASFDEARTLATLRLLAAAAGQRQIILFTHHRHVADLAQSLQEHVIDVIAL